MGRLPGPAARSSRALLPFAARKNGPSARVKRSGVGWGLPISGEPTVRPRGFADRHPRTHRRRHPERLRGRFTPIADRAAQRGRGDTTRSRRQRSVFSRKQRQRCRSRAACERGDAERSRKLLAARCSRRLHPSVIQRARITRGPIPRIAADGNLPWAPRERQGSSEEQPSRYANRRRTIDTAGALAEDAADVRSSAARAACMRLTGRGDTTHHTRHRATYHCLTDRFLLRAARET